MKNEKESTPSKTKKILLISMFVAIIAIFVCAIVYQFVLIKNLEYKIDQLNSCAKACEISKIFC